MTSATRKPSASQSRISTSSTGLSSRASDANMSVTAAALSPRDAKTGTSCLAHVSLVPPVTITGVGNPCSWATETPVVSVGGLCFVISSILASRQVDSTASEGAQAAIDHEIGAGCHHRRQQRYRIGDGAALKWSQ